MSLCLWILAGRRRSRSTGLKNAEVIEQCTNLGDSTLFMGNWRFSLIMRGSTLM